LRDIKRPRLKKIDETRRNETTRIKINEIESDFLFLILTGAAPQVKLFYKKNGEKSTLGGLETQN